MDSGYALYVGSKLLGYSLWCALGLYLGGRKVFPAALGYGLARLAVVPMVLEARALDITPSMIVRFHEAGDGSLARILQRIMIDEIRHVRAGTTWFVWAANRLAHAFCPMARAGSRYRDMMATPIPPMARH